MMPGSCTTLVQLFGLNKFSEALSDFDNRLGASFAYFARCWILHKTSHSLVGINLATEEAMPKAPRCA